MRRFVVSLILFSTGLIAIDRTVFFRESPEQVVVRPDEETRINWTAGFLAARATVRLKRIEVDRHRESSGSAEANLTDARARARREAKEQASLKLVRALRYVQMDSSYGLLDRMHSDAALRERMGHLASKILVASDRTGEGYVTVDVALPLYGEGGVVSLVADNRYGSDVAPESEPGMIAESITGILIDVSEFKDFIPALEPRVLSDHGRLIYGAATASRRCAVDMGLVSYHTSREQAMKDKRLGFAPYYLFAAGVTGAGKTDVFLDMDDILRITGSEGGRKALSRCGVAFVVKKR